MPMSSSYLDLIADAGAAAITHIGLVDDLGTELTGGTYARQAVSWTSSGDGTSQLAEDETFDVPPGATVAGWRGFSAGSGGTDYGGADLDPEVFTNAGTYTLLAAGTAIVHDAA